MSQVAMYYGIIEVRVRTISWHPFTLFGPEHFHYKYQGRIRRLRSLYPPAESEKSCRFLKSVSFLQFRRKLDVDGA